MNVRSLRSTCLQLPAIVLLLAVAGCSSNEKLFDAPGDRENAGAGGSSGSLSGNGGYSFFDGNDDPGAAGSAGTAGGISDGFDAGAIDPYVLPPSVVLSDAGVALCGSVACVCNNGIDDDG